MGNWYLIKEDGEKFIGQYKGIGDEAWYDKTPFNFQIMGERHYAVFYVSDVKKMLTPVEVTRAMAKIESSKRG